MQSLILLLIIGAVVTLGAGYLGNDITLMIQSWGVGEGDIESPVMDTNLTINITRVQIPGGFDDLITQCIFTSQQTDLIPGTKLFCKLYEGTDIQTSNVFAEGIIILNNTVTAGNPVTIPVNTFTFMNSNDVDYVHNVAVLVQAPNT